MTPRRSARSIAFLTNADRRRLLPFVTRWCHDAKHGRHLEHQGRSADCHTCAALTDSLMQEVGARAATQGWASVSDVVRDLRRRPDVRASMLQDARRRYHGELRRRARPDRDAKDWFRPALEAASAAGDLHAPARIAEKLLEWAIEFAQDLDQRPEPGMPLPFARLALSLSKHFSVGYVADDVQQIWEEIVAACAVDPVTWARLDQLVLRHGDHGEDLGLERLGPDGTVVGLEDLGAARPLHEPTPVVTADPVGDDDGAAPTVVDAAAADLIGWMSSLSRKPSGRVQRAEAAERVREEMLRRHPAIDPSAADRFLDEREPAFAELVDQVVAELEP